MTRHLPHQLSYSGGLSSSESQTASSHAPGVLRQSSLQDQELLQCKSNGNSKDVSDEHLRISLVSAAEELVKKRLEEEFMKTKAEVQSLHSTNKELLDGQEEINEIIEDLETKTKGIEEQFNSLTLKREELEKELEALSEIEENPIDVDQV